MGIKDDLQSLSPGAIVEMFVIDTTELGGGIFRYVDGNDQAASILWQGNTYVPMDISAEGFEITSKGALPTPTLTVSNITRVLSAAIIQFDDLVGAKFYRYRTLAKYLDGRPAADPDAHFPFDSYVVDHKTEHNKIQIKWALSAAMDQEGRMLPGRQVLRDTCTHRYRVWNGSTHVYTNATCPYVSGSYYDANGVASSAANDVCGKRYSDCKLRYGSAPLPTRAFPGVRLF